MTISNELKRILKGKIERIDKEVSSLTQELVEVRKQLDDLINKNSSTKDRRDELVLEKQKIQSDINNN